MFFFSSRRRHTRLTCDWSSDVCSSDLEQTNSLKMFEFEIKPSKKIEFDIFKPISGLKMSNFFRRFNLKFNIGRASCRESVDIIGQAAAVNTCDAFDKYKLCGKDNSESQ